MEKITKFLQIAIILATSLGFIISSVIGQSSSGCTGAMVRNFTPCIGFLASGSNTSTPSSACCNSLRDLMSNGQDCLCVIVTGGAPFQVPINRTLAISLPRSCRMSGVPIECRATASPIPAPDNPGEGGSNMSPRSSPPNTRAPFIPQPFTPPSFTPGGGMGPPSTPRSDLVPTLTPPGMRPTLTSSASKPSTIDLQSIFVAILGVILLKFY